MRNRVMTRLVRADHICGPFPVLIRDLSSFQITSRSQCACSTCPVPADVGEQVFRGGVCGGEAGEVENGLGPGAPLAFFLVRDVPLDEQGLLRVLEPGAGGCGQDADGAGLDPAAADLTGRGGDRGVLPVQRVEFGVQIRLVAQDGPQPVRVLDRAQEQGVVPVRLHGVAGDDGPGQRQRGEQGLEVADLVRLASLGDPVLGDHDPGHVGDGGEQVHLLVLAVFRALALLAVDGDALACGNVSRGPHAAGSSQGWAGCGRNHPSSRSSRNASAAGGLRFLFFCFPSCSRCCSARCAAYAAGTAGSSARTATAAVSAASNSSGSTSFGSLSSIDADGAAASPSAGWSSSRAPPVLPDPSPPPPARWAAARKAPPPCPRPPPTPATSAHAACPAASWYRPAAPPAPGGTTPGQARTRQAGGGGGNR